MEAVLQRINGFVWGAPALVLILGIGLYLSFLTGFAQLRLFPAAMRKLGRMLAGGDRRDSFRALCTALAATVGTGNIVGVAGAICLGGPGSVFWMWVCALLGMMTKYAEALLAVVYRERGEDGQILAGPMYMIRRGLCPGARFLAPAYCLFGCLAAFGVGNATQINAVLDSAGAAAAFLGWELPRWCRILLGAALGLLALWSLLGGTKRIGNMASRLIPFAAGAYLLLCLAALLARFDRIAPAFCGILEGAFSPGAVTGGVLGSAFGAVRVGVARGVFSNEAGMGTAAMAHGTANPEDPCDQGLMGILEVFVDTVVICTVTALVILTSGVSVPYGVDPGAVLTLEAFSRVLGPWVSPVLFVFLGLFAFATVLGWGFYGIRCARFLFGRWGEKPFAVLMLLGSLAGIFLGTGPVWTLSETVNGLMAVPSLLALAWLSPQVAGLTHGYQKKSTRGHSFFGQSEGRVERGTKQYSPPQR